LRSKSNHAPSSTMPSRSVRRTTFDVRRTQAHAVYNPAFVERLFNGTNLILKLKPFNHFSTRQGRSNSVQSRTPDQCVYQRAIDSSNQIGDATSFASSTLTLFSSGESRRRPHVSCSRRSPNAHRFVTTSSMTSHVTTGHSAYLLSTDRLALSHFAESGNAHLTSH
jgi:hypothetical protein